VYLDPAPTPEDHLRISRAAARRPADRRWPPAVRSGGRVLRVEQPELASQDDSAVYDVILLDHVLERTLSPRDFLVAAGRLLAPDGQLVVMTPNTGSTEFAVFGGRHWSGYDFPRHRSLFGAAQLRLLAAAAGLELRTVTTASDVRQWSRSVRNLAADWHVPTWVRGVLRFAWPVYAAVEALARWRARGNVLIASLSRPAGHQATSPASR
jgi:hypothetical protein